MKSVEIQAEIDRKLTERAEEAAKGQQTNHEHVIQLQNEIDILSMQLSDAKAEEANQQAHEVKLQEATEEAAYLLDDIELAGVPIAESGLSELAFSILKAKVQAKYVAKVEFYLNALKEQESQYQNDVKQVLERVTEAEGRAGRLETENNRLETENYKITLDNESLSEKVTKGAELLAEAQETIKQQTEWLDDFRKKELLGERSAQKVISTDEQIKQQEEALKASRIRVTSMEVKDPNDFARKTWTVTLALTGETKDINYLEKGNYTVITEAEAEQLREEAKAALDSIPSIPQLTEIQPLPTPELTAPQEGQTHTPQEDSNNDVHSGGTEATEGDQALHEVVQQPTLTLESLKAELDALKSEHGARLDNIERHANLPAVA